MAQAFKLTDNQKHVAELLYNFGNLTEGHTGERVMPSRVAELIKKGVFEKTNGTDPINYWELRFTLEGQAWADAEFGTPDPAPDDNDSQPAASPTALDYAILDEIRDAGMEDLEAMHADDQFADVDKMVTDAAIPFAPHDHNFNLRENGDDFVECTICGVTEPLPNTPASVPSESASTPDSAVLDTVQVSSSVKAKNTPVWTHSTSGWELVHVHYWNQRITMDKDYKPFDAVLITHGRPSRNRAKTAQNKARGSRKVQFTVNMEKNTEKAQNWRNRRNLANATAMPVPQVTGLQLLQKAARLTTTLERRRAA